MTDNRRDVVIVGASGAGLLTGYLLARQGYRVGVYEQQRRYRPPRRTLIVTSSLRRVLPVDFSPAVLHATPWMTVATRRREVTIELQEPDWILERSRLLHLLLEKAQEAGCRVYFGHRFLGLERDRQRILARFQRPRRGDITVEVGRALVGADGVFSQVAVAAGLPRAPHIPIIQAEVSLPPGWDPRRTQVWFFPQDTRYFFWLIPEGEGRGVLGLMTDHGVHPHPPMKRFLERLSLKPHRFQGARVALYHPRLRAWKRLGPVDLFLVGDAAGQVKNTTVGGTVTGFWGAQAVAQAIAQGVPFAKAARGLHRELLLHWWVRKALHGFSEAGYDALLRSLTPAVRQFLERRTRDEMAPALWKLVATTPALWALAPHVLRSLVQPTPGPIFPS